MGMKISILYLGKMEFPKFRLVDWKDEGAMVQSPAVAILIQHPTLGNILYDTGNCEDFSAVYTEDMLHDYPITEMISIQEALAQKGLTPDDIDLIILSHLHFDHAGGLKHFVGTKAIRRVLVSEADLKNAYWSVMTGNGGADIRARCGGDSVSNHSGDDQAGGGLGTLHSGFPHPGRHRYGAENRPPRHHPHHQ